MLIKKSICIFTHFSNLPYILQYVLVYVNELSKYFDEVIMATNRRNFNNQPSFNGNVDIQILENEGYDLGMFYKVFQTIQPSNYSQIACINDSNILFNKLDSIFKWGKNTQSDFWGLIDSNEKPWFSTHPENYHIQSHFIVFNESAIKYLNPFFNTIDIQHILNEKDLKKLRRLVINHWEIGLSQFLYSKDLKSDSYINSRSVLAKHKNKDKNITHSHYTELIKKNYPLIKKKVVLKKSWRSVFGKKEYWERLLAEYGCNDWDVSFFIREVKR